MIREMWTEENDMKHEQRSRQCKIPSLSLTNLQADQKQMLHTLSLSLFFVSLSV